MPGRDVRYRVLGPIDVMRDGQPLAISRGKPRALLAALLIDANRAVSVEELIDRLWGARPPPTAAKNLQGLVSQIRKALAGVGDDPLATVTGGYTLRVRPGETDVDQFEELLEQGRVQLADGRPGEAERTLDEALSVWRGRPYEDVVYEDFAREEIARLEERRTVATEERFEAMLAGGRHADAVAGLERLAAQQPLRERVLGLLMLALYRCGRRADALAVYDTARRRLSDELGIEPGEPLRRLHAAILEGTDDEPAGPIDLAAPEPSRRRSARLLAVAGVLVLTAAVALAIDISHGGGSARITKLTGDSVGVIEPATGRIVGQFDVGSAPSAVVAAAHAAWTVNAGEGTVSRVDLGNGAVRRTGGVGTPAGLALGAGSLWVSYATPVAGGRYSIGVLRLDPDTLRARAQIPILARTQWGGGGLPVMATEHAIWIAGLPGRLYRVDPTSQRVTLAARLSDPITGDVSLTGMVALDGAIWGVTDARSVVRIDPATGAVTRQSGLDTISLGGIVAGAGSLWVNDPLYGRVWRLEPDPPHRPHDLITGQSASNIAFGDGAVWVTSDIDGTLVRIDPATERLRRFSVGNTPGAVTVSPAGVLVTATGASQGADAAGRAAPPGGGVNADSCGSVIYGGPGRPQFVIAADLALSDPGFTPYTRRMAQAIEYELRAHDFAAGPYRLGLQICDRTTPSGDNLCVPNAKAYAATATLIGVIGPDDSGCAFDELHLLNRSGPVAVVSPVTTNPALTTTTPGAALSFLYPTGVRNYARVIPPNNLQAVAGALLAKRLGLRRVYIFLEDPNDFLGSDMAPAFARAARQLGIQVIGPQSPRGPYQRLSRHLAEQKVDGVFMPGYNDRRGLAFVRSMRTALGLSVPLIGSVDGFYLGADATAEQRRAQQGMYLLGVDITDPSRQLPPTGRAFAAAFGATRPAGANDAWAPYAAQATDVLLAAIARSDGTRASVSQQLFRVHVRDGILGSFTFTPGGDISPSTVTAYRTIAGPGLIRAYQVIRAPATAN